MLHLDACSLNLLDVAYEVRDNVKTLVSSQYLGWSYFAYDDYAGSFLLSPVPGPNVPSATPSTCRSSTLPISPAS